MAEAMGWPTDQIGWHDLFDLATDPHGWARYGHPEWGRFTLGKTNPNFSTSGLNALIGEYYAATGTSSDLTTDAIADPAVVRFVQGVESAVVHYGDISTTFLENLRRADEAGHGLTYVSAIAIEEKSVWDYNQGNPSGDVATLGDQAPPSIPLAAVYPVEGTLVNDHPYAILDAPWVSPLRRAIAEDFLRFVLTPEQQERFQEAGFRDHAGRPGDAIDPSNGLLPDQPAVTLSTPSAVVLDAIQRSWADLRKRAHVLLVLDVSGSMGDVAGDSGDSKLDLAKRAAIQALAQFEPDDAVGLWIFSSELGPGGEPFRELSPMSALGPKREELRERIGSLETSGGTGLYATVDHAVDVMHGSFDPDRINGIVVADRRQERLRGVRLPRSVDLDAGPPAGRSDGAGVLHRLRPRRGPGDARADLERVHRHHLRRLRPRDDRRCVRRRDLELLMDTRRTLDPAAAGLGLGASVASWTVGIPFPIGAAIGAVTFAVASPELIRHLLASRGWANESAVRRSRKRRDRPRIPGCAPASVRSERSIGASRRWVKGRCASGCRRSPEKPTCCSTTSGRSPGRRPRSARPNTGWTRRG